MASNLVEKGWKLFEDIETINFNSSILIFFCINLKPYPTNKC